MTRPLFTQAERRKLSELVSASREVILSSSFPNGAIVAANSGLAVYPKGAQDYLGVWPRDSSYIAMAADCLGMREVPERFFAWCVERCEGFSEQGVFGTQHHLTGAVGGTALDREELHLSPGFVKEFLHVGGRCSQFQPDQNASVIIAAEFHLRRWGLKLKENGVIARLVSTAARGLVERWDSSLGPGGGFTIPYWDCWEERVCAPGRHHLYSLAMSWRGLSLASELLGGMKAYSGQARRWRAVSEQMRSAFMLAYSSHDVLPRTFPVRKEKYRHSHAAGAKIDSLTDSSLLGVVWPARMLSPHDQKMVRTVQRICKDNACRGGLLRYPGDPYCGGMRKGTPTFTGAGPWPILSCFAALFHLEAGQPEEAAGHIRWVLANSGRYWPYLPEQVHAEEKPSIVPLAWSHAMLVLALDALGFPLGRRKP